MHISTDLNTLSVSGAKSFTNGGELRLFFGLKLVLTKKFASTKEVHDHLQDTYFDEMGSSGYYWFLPEARKGFVDKDFGYSINEVPSDAVTEAFEFGEHTTTIQIVLMAYPEDIDEEITATCSELNEYREAGYIESFQQFWLY